MGETKIEPNTKCIAIFNLQSDQPKELSLTKGEILTFIRYTSDPKWGVVSNESGSKGFVPLDYIQPRGVRMLEMPWYHGNLSREDSEELVSVHPHLNGRFLVRDSVKYKGDYTLTLFNDSKVEHYRIRVRFGMYTIDEETEFSTLNEIVRHYQDNKNLTTLKHYLTEGVIKSGCAEVTVNSNDFKKSGWCIDRKKLEMFEVLGRGEFGEIRKARYKEEMVAVKCVSGHYTNDKFLAEASIMTKLQHPNLVKLIGVVMDKSCYIVLEFMAMGNLLDYLRSRGRAVISLSDQHKFAKDVANGMSYLEQENVIHRDLAARNVLLDDDKTAKVSDFGLTRDVDVAKSGGKFPVKWTAPEAVERNAFSNKSDVWSYGVFLWEVYSFGRVPYPGISKEAVLSYIHSNKRMDSPDGCPSEIYSIMRKCWSELPKDRPSFAELVNLIGKP